MKLSSTCPGLLVLAAACVFLPLNVAADGRIEINQASIEAAGGFPYIISEPGSYVLTGNLVVESDVSAILIHGPLVASRGVSLDLNGFSIQGASTCTTMENCTLGSANAIGPFAGFAGDISVRGGTVRGFSGHCISLAKNSRVENMRVAQCGRNGILVDTGSVVLGNRVDFTGHYGIQMESGTTYAHNTIADTGISSGTHSAVRGGSATAGNFCDDGSCSPSWMRRYYLTSNSHDGSTAGNACATGFHVASLWEIYDPSSLRYASNLGVAVGQSSGPPVAIGWAYFGIPGATCEDWTSTSGDGSYIVFETAGSPEFGPWHLVQTACTNSHQVWCVED